jgi:large subunit ribosomal protein L44e
MLCLAVQQLIWRQCRIGHGQLPKDDKDPLQDMQNTSGAGTARKKNKECMPICYANRGQRIFVPDNALWLQEHKVTQYKTGAARLLAQGKRRYDRKMRGFGGQKKPIFHKKAKVTKKISLKLTCSECSRSSQRCIGRTKNFILGTAPGKSKKGEALNY